MGTTTYAGKLADPEFRSQRASKAAKARTSIDYHIQRIVDSAPKLTPAQAERLASILTGAVDGEAGK